MQRLKNTKNLTTAAMLLAVSVILSFFKIPITNIVELRFNSLPIAVSGYLFGPVVGGVVGALADILGYIVKPTGPFFPGFTLSSALTGVIYGSLLYRRELTVARAALAEAVQAVVVSMFLNSLSLAILYGNGFWFVFTARILKSIVMLPVNTVLLLGVMKPVVIFKDNSVLPVGR